MNFDLNSLASNIQSWELKDWGIAIGILVGATTILTFFGKIVHWCMQAFLKLKKLRVVFFPTTSSTEIDLRFILNYAQSFWSIGSQNGAPIMQIVSRWNVTNASRVSVRLITAHLIKPKLKDPNRFTMVLTEDPFNSIHSNEYFIQPLQTRNVSISFYLGPPSQKKGKPLKVKMIVIDQYANKHRVAFILKGLE